MLTFRTKSIPSRTRDLGLVFKKESFSRNVVGFEREAFRRVESGQVGESGSQLRIWIRVLWSLEVGNHRLKKRNSSISVSGSDEVFHSLAPVRSRALMFLFFVHGCGWLMNNGGRWDLEIVLVKIVEKVRKYLCCYAMNELCFSFVYIHFLNTSTLFNSITNVSKTESFDNNISDSPTPNYLIYTSWSYHLLEFKIHIEIWFSLIILNSPIFCTT